MTAPVILVIRSQSNWEAFFDLSLDMLRIAGFDGYFKVLNPAWEKTLGWTIAEMIAVPWLDFVHPELVLLAPQERTPAS